MCSAKSVRRLFYTVISIAHKLTTYLRIKYNSGSMYTAVTIYGDECSRINNIGGNCNLFVLKNPIHFQVEEKKNQ